MSQSNVFAGTLTNLSRRESKYWCGLLPFPPSSNKLFAGKARRYISPRYREWKEHAGRALQAQRLEHFSVPVAETISLQRPLKKDGGMKKYDVANFEKAINDLLVTHSVLMDDSLIHKLTLQWDDGVVGALVEIEEMA